MEIIKQDFEFLNVIYDSEKKVRDYIGMLYEELFYEMNDMDSDQEEIIPSQYQIVRRAWYEFEDLYFQYIMAGKGGDYGAQVRQRINNGESVDEIIDEFVELKDHNAGYGLFFAYEREESLLIKDVSNAMVRFNMSYMKDKSDEDFFWDDGAPIKKEDWINPAIAEVW